MDNKFNREKNQHNFCGKEGNKENNKIKQIMINSLLTLRKKNNNKRIISKLKDNNISLYSPVEKNYILSNTSFEIPNSFNEYYNNIRNKNIFLYEAINKEEEIISKFSIEKNNLTKFILLQINYYIEYMLKNKKTNIDYLENFFDNNTINSLIRILYEYTNKDNLYIIKETINNKINDNQIIVYNISKILIKLTTISNYFTSLIINDESNIYMIFLSLKYYYKINQLLSNYIINLLYNCYMDNEIEILNKCNGLVPFFLVNLSNFQKNPMRNIIESNLLLNIIEFLTNLLNENTFNIYMNNPNINNCILLMINIIQNYDNENIKHSSIKCLAHLLHCIDENNILKIDNFKNIIKYLIPYLNVEINNASIVIKALEIISLFTYLYEIDQFVNNELIDEINQILMDFVLHKEQNKILFLNNENINQKFNNIIENISIILLTCCLSKKVYEFIVYHTLIIKNIIIIIYNYSIEIQILKYLYNFLNEFMSNQDNFMTLVLANFLDIGIIQSLDKYLDLRYFEIIFIILNFAYKSLEYGEIYKDQNNKNKQYSIINFVQIYFDKKGFNDKLNLIASPDFGNIECSDLSKKIQEIFFIFK